MLQRAAETVSGDDECNDPAVLLACALGSTGCPAKCAEAENNSQINNNNAYEGVVAGDLNIAVSTASSTTSIPNDGIIKVAELSLKASENIQLQSLDITRLGLSENSGIKAWIEKDGRRITSSSSFFGDSKANLTFNNGGYVVNGSETLDLVVSLSGVDAGSELQFKVSNVTSSAKNTTVSPDTTGVFRTTKYSATSISFVNVTNTTRSYDLASDTTFTFGEFKLQNDSPASMEKDVLIKSITFKIDGSIENLTNFKLLRDSKEVSSKYSVDGKSITFAVNDQLDSGKSATYKVTAEPTNIENQDGDKYTLSIKKSEDVIAEELGDNATAYRVSIKSNVGNFALSFWEVTIKGGNVVLSKDSNLASTVNANWGYSDVVVAKGTMKVNQGVKFDKFNIDVTHLYSGSDEVNTIKLSDIIRRAALVIDGKSYTLDIPSATWTGTLSTDSEISLSKGTHDVELQVSLSNTERVITKITFASIWKTSFPSVNYTNGDETQFKSTSIAGTIKVSDLNVQMQRSSIKKTGPSEDIKVVGGNTDEKVLLVGEISNTSDKVLEINKFLVAGNWFAWTATELWDVYLVIWDASSSMYKVETSSNTIKTVTIDSVSTTIEAGKSVKFEIRYIPNADLTTTNVTSSFKFSVSAAGKLDGNDTETSSLNSAKVTITDRATSTIVGNTTDNKQIIKPGVSTKVASFNYNVKNDSIDLSSLQLTTAGITASMLDDVTVDFGGNVWTPSLEFDTNTTDVLNIEFSNIVTLPVNNYKVNVYVTFNDDAISTAATQAAAPLNTAKEIKGVKVNNDSATSATLWYKHYVAKAYPILAVKDKNTTSENARLDISILKSNDDAYSVYMSWINNNAANAMTGSNYYWTVVEWSDTDLTKISIDRSNATVIRSSKALLGDDMQKSISKISFVVQDDEWKWAQYSDVDAWSDFASLSL